MAGRGDPATAGLLPGRILPSDYLGQQALVAVRRDRRRVEVLQPALKLRLGRPGRRQLLVAPKQREGGRTFHRV